MIMRPLCFLLFLPFISFAQSSLRGKVTNVHQEGLDAATVFLIGTEYMAATDINGNYEIKGIADGSYQVKISYVGYKSIIDPIEINGDMQKDIQLLGELFQLNEVEIQANRVKDNSPFTKTNLTSAQIQAQNQGQDAPYALQWTPSVVASSDAGTGIGYTNLRMRGVDQTRINVTLNGAPVNDAESHNVFWVDLPDLMSSTADIQIQRGVGTSSNGAGAFGGTISINTAKIRVNPYAEIVTGLGSYQTKRLSIAAGTGLMNNKYSVDARYSISSSDGYIDRASAKLKSFDLSALRLFTKGSLRFNILTGSEVTYQSWYGTPASKLTGSLTDLQQHYSRNIGSVYKSASDSINLFASDRKYNYYQFKDQVDDYGQYYLQMIHNHQWTKSFKTKGLLYYTKGVGAYIESRPQELITDYGLLPKDTSDTTFDAIRSRWLQNHLVGANIDIAYDMTGDISFESGLSYNTYYGDHYGKLRNDTTVTFPAAPLSGYRYYSSQSVKTDRAIYARMLYNRSPKWQFMLDLQLRNIHYQFDGTNSDRRPIFLDVSYTFFNPKLGISYNVDKDKMVYFSVAKASKEPIRSDFVDVLNSPMPRPESMVNTELGYQLVRPKYRVQTNGYLMLYKDQLVLSGALNDVGAALRTNVGNSYRLGWETDGALLVSSIWTLGGNLTISKNKIADFEEVLYDYTTDYEIKKIQHRNVDISYSPQLIQSAYVQFNLSKHWEFSLSSKYVSKQYLDNTGSDERSMPAFNYQQLGILFKTSTKRLKTIEISLNVNNLFNQSYVSNGYTYSYVVGTRIDENYFYPQAPRHFMCNVRAKF
jgi:iron complex outermembrane recepter protein